MRCDKVLIIAVKEFKALVLNPTFLLIAGFCSLIWSYSYIRAMLTFASQSAMMSNVPSPSQNLHFSVFINHISYVNLIFVFSIPAITMKLMAEEKRQRTIDLLLTSPINSLEIALGKFFGGYCVVLTLLIVSLFYPLATATLTEISWGPLLSSYLGLSLLAAVYVATGFLASCLAASSVLAVILGVLLNLSIWFVGQGGDLVDRGPVADFLQYISVGDHFMKFLKGGIEISSIVFALSLVTFLIFFSQRIVESMRWR
jgi:ABC-2 type transport system permease protein